VHEHHPEPFAAEHLARLRAGVVELAGLSDHDRPRTDHEDRGNVVSPRHQPISLRNRSKSGRASFGPGAASGWYWTENAGMSRHRRPSSVPSFRFQCESTPRPRSVWTVAPSLRHPAGSTANPWLCDVIAMRPDSTSFTGWFTPRWPNRSLKVRPPRASASTW